MKILLLLSALALALCSTSKASTKPPVEKGLILHLDAATFSDGAETWSDSSASKNHASRHWNKSYKTTKTYKGKSYEAIKITPHSGFTIRGTFNNPYTIFVVDEYNSGSQHRGRNLQSRSNNWLLGKWAGRESHYAEGWLNWVPPVVTEFQTPVIACGTMDSSRNGNFYINGQQSGSPRGGLRPPTTLGLGTGGRHREATDGWVSIVLAYNRVLSDTERSQVNWWLHDRYGMTVPHAGLCANNNGGCDKLVTCTDKRHERECGKCPAGYTGSGDQGCKDIDECQTNNGGCDKLTSCVNTPGSFTCGACPAGYSGTGRSGCDDINECMENNGGCDKLTSCANTPGSFNCGPCATGYSGNGKTGCSDVDECATKNGGCDAATKCENTQGSYTCGDCPEGYSGSGLKGCVDIDECLHANGGCHRLTKCSNTAGGRTCGACPSGYEGDGVKGCKDINECERSNGDCDQLTKCINTRGSKRCGPCPPGYKGTGETGCTDIDECERRNGDCDQLTKCTNTPGGRTCGPCPAGYDGNGVIGCEKQYEGSATESASDMTARIAETAAKKKVEDLEAKHAEWLKNKILEEEAQEKKDRLKRLQMETKKLELLTKIENTKKEEDDKRAEEIKKQAAKTAALEADRKLMEQAKAAALAIHDELSKKYGKMLVAKDATGALASTAPIGDKATAVAN